MVVSRPTSSRSGYTNIAKVRRKDFEASLDADITKDKSHSLSIYLMALFPPTDGLCDQYREYNAFSLSFYVDINDVRLASLQRLVLF